MNSSLYEEEYDNFEDAQEDWSDDFFEDTCGNRGRFDEQDEMESLNADQIGMAMAFGEFVFDEKKVYDVDENTDNENFENSLKLYPLQGYYNSTKTRKLPVFEQYINEIICGTQKSPWSDKL